MSRVLIVSNTVLQIIFAVNLKYTQFINDDVDIIISDHTNNAELIVANSQGLTAFSNVYYVKTKDFTRSPAHIISDGIIGLIKDEFTKEKILDGFVRFKNDYDVILAANPDKFSSLLFECMYKRNGQLKYYLYEDGLSAYCVLGEILKKQRHARLSFIHRIIDRIVHKEYASKNIAGLYLFSPELCQWEDGISLLRMPKIDPQNKALVETLNTMFDYHHTEDSYKATSNN